MQVLMKNLLEKFVVKKNILCHHIRWVYYFYKPNISTLLLCENYFSHKTGQKYKKGS